MKPLINWAGIALLTIATTGFSSPILHPQSSQLLLEQDSIPVPIDPESDEITLTSFPTWETTHLQARRLLALSTTGILSTVFQQDKTADSDLAGVPIALPDYIADCANDEDSPLTTLLGPGNPLILALNIGTTFRNTKAGSNISLSIDWWQHAGQEQDGRDVLDRSPAGLPRLSLIGSLEPLPVTVLAEVREEMESCFLAAHPDSVYWLPGHSDAAHRGYWARLVVQKALWIGGFGDRARIGWLDVDAWKGITKHGEDGKRGWGDVKLPGE